jgi:hypothetical protein
MGGIQSSNNKPSVDPREAAIRNFNLRVKSYSYSHHGPYYDYIEWCRAQYELECIPEWCRQGGNYNPHNHDY